VPPSAYRQALNDNNAPQAPGQSSAPAPGGP
jgi:hypothetical protein